MKSKLLQSMLLTLALAASINFCILQSTQATTNSKTAKNISTNEKTIPAHAEPGTNIQYDSNDNMIILNGKIKNTDNNAKTNKSLPKPQAGMTVSYDGAGDPTFIKINGNQYDNSSKNANKKFKLNSGYSYNDTGAISWFDDVKGQADHDLADYDCATDENADDCALGTDIYAQDKDTGIWGSFKKWDVGNLYGQEVPRIVDVWNVKVFERVYNVNDGVSQGLLQNGYYYHD